MRCLSYLRNAFSSKFSLVLADRENNYLLLHLVIASSSTQGRWLTCSYACMSSKFSPDYSKTTLRQIDANATTRNLDWPVKDVGGGNHMDLSNCSLWVIVDDCTWHTGGFHSSKSTTYHVLTMGPSLRNRYEDGRRLK